jgi:hypothetical protein
MMTGLDGWLERATRRLSRESTAQVRREIEEHYEAAREAAVSGGASGEEAERLAVMALGDAKVANCQYRKVLLTAGEAKLLRDGNWEARMVCSRPWLRRVGPVISLAALLAAGAMFFAGALAAAWTLVAVGMALGLMFAAPLLPVYTPLRGRVFRSVKWVVVIGALGSAFGADALQWSWLLVSCLWPVAWIEWRRVSIRRKLPVEKWPKQLYL